MRNRALGPVILAAGRALVRWLVFALAVAAFWLLPMMALPDPAFAEFTSSCKDSTSKPAGNGHNRLALLIGNGAYNDNGLRKLNFSVNDVRALAKKFSETGLDDFTVCSYTDLKTKGDFEAAVTDFVGRVKPDDEVLFFYSGHGFGVEGQGNFYLALDAMGPEKFAQGQDGAKRREYEKDEQKLRADYSAKVQEHAIAEQWIESQIRDKGASVFLIFADACRDLLPDGRKGIGAGLKSGIRVPASASGTFRFYSAQLNQSSYEPDVYSSGNDQSDKDKGKGKSLPEGNSIFTGVLLRYIDLPGQSIEALAATIKRDVSRTAARNAVQQSPEYYAGLAGEYFINRVAVSADANSSPACAQFEADFSDLEAKASSGRLLRSDIDAVENGSASECPSAFRRLQRLRALAQGGYGSYAAKTTTGGGGANAAIDKCDALAASPLDPSLPEEVRSADILDLQSLVFKSVSGTLGQEDAQKAVAAAVAACTESLRKNGRVARFAYNIGRAFNASALLNGSSQAGLADVFKAYKFFNAAAEQGYVAAYNDIAVLYENGIAGKRLDKSGKETSEWERKPPDRLQAKENYTKSADLGYVIAQYNLGLKYRYGDIGLPVDSARAYQLLSRAAEAGFVSAKIEAALILRSGLAGVEEDPQRATRLLKEAASTGSLEAMYRLGTLYYFGRWPKLAADPGEALLWFARAADLGHVESQWWLASMLTEGEGVPAAQPQAAGRYWRIAAVNGSQGAQVQLALLLQKNKVPFDPNPAKAAKEIPRLFADAMDRGYAPAALEYAKLLRQGQPVDRTRSIVPDKAKAVGYAERAIELAQRTDPSSWEGNPLNEYEAAFLLIDMIDKKEMVRRDKTSIVPESRIAQLRALYGKPETRRVLAVRIFDCRGTKDDFYAFDVWDWKRAEPPTTWQFDWFERYYGCTIPRYYRDAIAKVHKDTRSDNKTSFADRIVKKAAQMACVVKWQDGERGLDENKRTNPDRIESKCKTNGSDG